MSDVFRDPNVGWAAILIVLLPLVIIGIGEIEERLRQRDSPLRRPVSIVRTWVVPLFAVWSLIQVLFDGEASNAVDKFVGSALVVASSAAVLAALAIIVEMFASRPRAEGRRSIPRLLLAMPKLVVLLVTVWLLVAGVWSVNLSAALTALGVTSLVVSFALQDTLGGIASGFTLLADQPFQPGDWIQTGELEGRVLDVNWRSSRIETRNGDLVVVPNGQLATATITNFDEPTRLHRVVVSLQVAYANAPTRAKDMLLAAAAATPGVLEMPPPSVFVTQIDDPLMGYSVQMWIDDYSIAPRVQSDFGALVWYHSHRFDVPLPSPAQDLYLWDGPATAAEGVPDHAALLRAVRTSPLIADLPDDEVDGLASGAKLVGFSKGETIRGDDPHGIGIIRRGRARLVLQTPSGDEPALEYQPGDLIGVQDIDDLPVVVIAVTDCDVVELDAATAGGAISRSPALSAAIEQIANSRRRRVERVARRLGLDTASTEASEQTDAAPARLVDGEPLESPDVTADGVGS